MGVSPEGQRRVLAGILAAAGADGLDTLVLQGLSQACDRWLAKVLSTNTQRLRELVVDNCAGIALSRAASKALQASCHASLSRLVLRRLPRVTCLGQVDLLRRKQGLSLTRLSHLELDLLHYF